MNSPAPLERHALPISFRAGAAAAAAAAAATAAAAGTSDIAAAAAVAAVAAAASAAAVGSAAITSPLLDTDRLTCLPTNSSRWLHSSSSAHPASSTPCVCVCA
jgi:hypothetical protein